MSSVLGNDISRLKCYSKSVDLVSTLDWHILFPIPHRHSTDNVELYLYLWSYTHSDSFVCKKYIARQRESGYVRQWYTYCGRSSSRKGISSLGTRPGPVPRQGKLRIYVSIWCKSGILTCNWCKIWRERTAG